MGLPVEVGTVVLSFRVPPQETLPNQPVRASTLGDEDGSQVDDRLRTGTDYPSPSSFSPPSPSPGDVDIFVGGVESRSSRHSVGL